MAALGSLAALSGLGFSDLVWRAVPLVNLHPLPPPGEPGCFSESKSVLTLCPGEPGAN